MVLLDPMSVDEVDMYKRLFLIHSSVIDEPAEAHFEGSKGVTSYGKNETNEEDLRRYPITVRLMLFSGNCYQIFAEQENEHRKTCRFSFLAISN